MAKCARCGKSGIFLKVNAIGICKSCEFLYGQECFRQAYRKQVAQHPNPPISSKTNKVITKYFDLNILEEINAIPVPPCPSIQNIEEYRDRKYDSVICKLQEAATIHKKSGNLELAIACLRKSNELMPYSRFTYDKCCFKLVEYLKDAGKFDEARLEEIKIKSLIQQLDKIRYTSNDWLWDDDTGDSIRFFASRICPYCSIYNQRMFSKSGTDKRFPPLSKLPFDLQGGKCPVCGSTLTIFPYSGYTEETVKELIEISNRPFADNRTDELKEWFEEEQAKKISFAQDKADYDWLREHLPDIAPKSFGGYRRMKNLKSANYLKIVATAKEHDYLIK